MRRRLLLPVLVFWVGFQAAAARAQTPPPHNPVGVEDAQRKGAIQSCAKCHQAEYQAWKKGPHAHAYKAVIEQWLKAYDPASTMSPQGLRDFHKMKDITNCMRCHAPPRNVFEGIVDKDWDGKGPFSSDKLKVSDTDPVLTSGVDCLTCHAAGGKVITRADYKRTPGLVPKKGFCDPQPSVAFSQRTACIGCHATVVQAYTLDVDPAKHVAPRLACEACHMEKDAKGRRHHLYYYELDGKKFEKLSRPLFEGFAADVQRSGGGLKLEVRWPLASVPHPFLPDTVRSYIVKLRLLDGQKELYTRTLRFFSPTNRSADDIRALNPADELINVVPPETFTRSYALPAGVGTSGTVELTVLKKPNFDYPDDELVKEVFRRETAFKL